MRPNQLSPSFFRAAFLTFLTPALVAAAPAPSAAPDPAFPNAAAARNVFYQVSPELRRKIDGLIGKMSLEEKVLQLASHYPNGNARLGIPHMQAGECLHGVVTSGATSFPQAIALGSMWDPELMEKIGVVVAREARALGIHHCYSPMLGLARDPRWGRADESYGEDPYLVGQTGAAYIRGLQGTGRDRFGKDHILATAKHYVADGEPLAGDNGAAVEISERSLQQTHLVPFRAAVQQAGVGAIMPAHHELNGVPCHVNTHILTEVLRSQFGFDGLIVSDNNDILRAWSEFKISRDLDDVIRMALENDVTTELAWKAPWGKRRVYSSPLMEAVKNGKIPVALVDRQVRKVLEYKFKLGLFEDETAMNPANSLSELKEGSEKQEAYANTKTAITKRRKDYKKVLDSPASNRLALEAAEKALILLKNKNGLLPLDRAKLRTIAVVGPNADRQLLGGYSTKHPRYFVTVLDGIKKHAAPGTKVLHARGVDIHSPSTDGIAEAVDIAKKADAVIVAVGGDDETIKENTDRDDITMAGPQRQLVQALVATGKPVVMVFIHGRALAIGWEKDHVGAILDAWFLGQETGNAVARTIFGDNNPGGKLTVTVPPNVGQAPCYYNILPSGRPRRLYGSKPGPLFTFGFGLSYTAFKLGEYELSAKTMRPNETVRAGVKVTNTGKRPGDEVVQMYVHKKYCSLVQPKLELKGFERITLKPGESKTVELPIDRSALEIWKDGRWAVELGEYEIMLGTDSAHLKKLALTVD